MHCSLQLQKQIGLKRNAGFSLIELIVVIAIIAIVLSISTIPFNHWQKKSAMESEIRQIYTDIQNARISAVTQKTVYGVIMQPYGYNLKTFTSAYEYSTIPNASTYGTLVTSKTYPYQLTYSNATTAFSNTNNAIIFATNGITTTTANIIIVSNPISESPAANCIVVSSAHDNLGRWNAATSKCEIN